MFAITAYEIDTSIQSQTPFDPDHPQALSDLGSITSERKVLVVPPEDPMELPLRSTMMIRAGVFTVAAKDLELDTVSGRFQLLVRALETHQFDIDWSLNVQMSKAAESLVSVWGQDGSVVWVASLPRNVTLSFVEVPRAFRDVAEAQPILLQALRSGIFGANALPPPVPPPLMDYAAGVPPCPG